MSGPRSGGQASAGPVVTVVSPHYDDVPLSGGQSLVDGDLSRAEVTVWVAFGRTNWSVKMHPSRRRAPVITLWRRAEEQLAARRFGYRVRSDSLEEVILRTGSLDSESFRNDEPLDEDELVIRLVALMKRWRGGADELWVPAGIGRHVDHRIVAMAAAELVRGGETGVAFYEDRPYAADYDDGEMLGEMAELGLDLEPRIVSGPVRESTHRAVQRIYRSQMDDYFLAAQRKDLELGRPERVWVPARLREVTDG